MKIPSLLAPIKQLSDSSPLLGKIIRGAGWLIFDRIVQLFASICVGIWVARYLGADQFGVLSFVLSFVALFGAASTLGINNIAVRQLVREPEEAPVIVGTTFFLLIIGGLLSILIVNLAAWWLQYESPHIRWLIFVSCLTLLFQASIALRLWFESRLEMKFISWSLAAAVVIVGVVKLALIFLGASLVHFIYASVLESALVFIFLFYSYSSASSDLKLCRVTFERAKSLLASSWPLLLSGVVLMIQARTDVIMLGQLSTNIQVGYYASALQLITALAVVPMMVQKLFLPMLVKSHGSDSKEQYDSMILNYYRLHFCIGLLLALPIFIFGEKIIVLLYGASFAPAGYLLSLMAIRLLLGHIGVARGAFLLNEDMMKFSFLTMLIGTVANVVLNYLLIPKYQAAGSMIATIISFSISVLVLDLFIRKTRGNVVRMVHSILTVGRLRLAAFDN